MTLIQEWGNAAWFLIHTMSEKLKDDHDSYNEIFELRDVLVNVCYNLPCPVCSNHAKNKIARVNLNDISSKETMKRFFFELHNTINDDLNKTRYSWQEFQNLYCLANTKEIVLYFIQIFRRINSGNLVMMLTKTDTDESVNRLIYYLNHNAHKFNP